MSSDSPPTARRRKQRVDVACDFCRQRKLGCDNAKPKCENCNDHQRDCTYAVQVRKDRPSNTRINTLRDENTRLRKELERLRSTSDADRTRNPDETRQVVSPRPSTSTGSQASALTNGQVPKASQTSLRDQDLITPTSIDSSTESHGAQFHGPTSAMFDREHPLKRGKTGPDGQATALQKIQLLAEAARQRQLELVNLRMGKLNFDGLDPKLGMDLLSIFWNRQHATGSVVYRPCFMRDMVSQGPFFSPLLLNAIFFVASKHSPIMEGSCNVGDNCNAGLPFRQKVEGFLHHAETRLLCKSSITTVQALLLMSDALFSWCDERSLSWHYLGIAISMIIDLGIHSENSTLALAKSASAEDTETHRRVFWAAFVLDKVQSIYQGRPARLRDMDCSVPIMFLDEYEELEPFASVGYSASPCGTGLPNHSVTTFEHLCKLSTIADRILCALYAEKSSQGDPEDLFRTSQVLHADLIQWRKSLPAHLGISFDTSGNPNSSSGCVALPHTLSLILMFHALLILLHRPFVSEGHLQSVAESATSDAFTMCENAALDIDVILRWYKSQWCIRSPPYFVSYSTYVSATIHVRVASQRQPKSKAHHCLRNCLEILSEHQNVCHAPRRSMGILLGLVDRLKVDVGADFRAIASRTVECEESSPKDNHRTSCISARPSLISGLSNNMATPLTTPMESHEVASTIVGLNSLGQTDSESQLVGYGLDELLPDMYFDIDPLFGFNDFQMYFDVNF